MPECPIEEQFELLNQLFLSASAEGKAQLLSAFLRLSLRPGIQPVVKQRITNVFERCGIVSFISVPCLPLDVPVPARTALPRWIKMASVPAAFAVLSKPWQNSCPLVSPPAGCSGAQWSTGPVTARP